MPALSSDLVKVALGCLALALGVASARAADAQVEQVFEENRRLQEQVRAQQKTIDDLNARLGEVLRTTERHERELRELSGRPDLARAVAPAPNGNREQEIRISGETGIAFFKTGSEGQFPKSEFRVDDPVIAVEAPVMKRVYFYTELKLLTREANSDNFQLGELYADFEDVSATWGKPGLLSFRAGRLNVPFGEEYQVRTPVSNPLISHSLSDIWGTDEGFEVYGKLGPAQYVVAVQNGGTSRLHDFNADKAVAGRLSWDPQRWLHVSASAMRTGELSSTGDYLSEVWFGNGFFRAIGNLGTTHTFWASLYEGDATVRWKSGHGSAAFGQARYGDTNLRANDSRRIRYGYLEVVQSIAEQLYGAARYSQIWAPHGYPLTGWGAAGEYFFAPSLTEELRRLSVGLGYRLGPPVVLKVEYTWESGRQPNGEKRDGENFFGSEIGLRF